MTATISLLPENRSRSIELGSLVRIRHTEALGILFWLSHVKSATPEQHIDCATVLDLDDQLVQHVRLTSLRVLTPGGDTAGEESALMARLCTFPCLDRVTRMCGTVGQSTWTAGKWHVSVSLDKGGLTRPRPLKDISFYDPMWDLYPLKF